MADEKLEALLKGWGLYYAVAPRREASDYVPRSERTVAHPIAQARQFSQGRKVKHATRKLVGRDGCSRLLIMGRAAGLKTAAGHTAPISADFVDPVRCKETNSGGFGSFESRPVPAELQRVEREVKALESLPGMMVRAMCLRAAYCVQGDSEGKAAWVTDEFRKASPHADPVKLNVYRNELAFAKVWIHARLIDRAA